MIPKEYDKIVHVPEPVLAQKAQPITDPLAPEIQELIPHLFEMMEKAKGIGLAAPQIGLNLAIAVLEHNGTRYTIINPTIVKHSASKVVFEEGCLSIPKKFMNIIRSESITVKYLNEHGKACKLKASGMLAIILQHEIDHLNGTVIADRYDKQAELRKKAGV